MRNAAVFRPGITALLTFCAHPLFGIRVRRQRPPLYLSLDQYKHECRGAGKAPLAKPSGVHTIAEPVDGGFGSALAVRDIERLEADFDHA